ncbi:MAG: D-alanyl-D-alanine carboxypeptidase family protein [Pseudomonadota bacterium]
MAMLRRFWIIRAFAFAASLAAASVFAAPASANSKYAAFVIHAHSGDILFSRHADRTRYPASLTKLMTLYLLFEKIEAGEYSLSTPLKISSNAAAEPPSKLGLKPGDTITVEEAINALVIRSANDVAVVVAENLAGSETTFARRMTAKARSLGMRRTTFRNASGLPNRRQVTTARELALLAQRVTQDFPEFADYFARTSFQYRGRTYRTHNNVLVQYAGATGLKTGYTRMSGYNLATTAERDGVPLIGVVLGGRSGRTRDAHMRLILDRAFSRVRQNPTILASVVRVRPEPSLRPDRSRDPRGALVGTPVLASDVDTLAMLIATSDDALFTATPAAEYGEGDASSPVEAPVRRGGYAVQIGAFETPEEAEAALLAVAAAAPPTLGGAAPSVAPFSVGGKSYHRARFVGLDRPSANAACAALVAEGRSCFVAAR